MDATTLEKFQASMQTDTRIEKQRLQASHSYLTQLQLQSADAPPQAAVAPQDSPAHGSILASSWEGSQNVYRVGQGGANQHDAPS